MILFKSGRLLNLQSMEGAFKTSMDDFRFSTVGYAISNPAASQLRLFENLDVSRDAG